MCLNNPKFSPPFGCFDPIHVASSSSYIDLAHVASSSCVGLAHLVLSSYVDPSVVLSSTIIHDPKGKKLVVDDVVELSIRPNPISKKQNYDHTAKFQDLWATKLPWAKMCLGLDGLLHNVKCKICNKAEGKDKLLALKWDTLCKHIGRKKQKANRKQKKN
jgi:hypothetical protein